MNHPICPNCQAPILPDAPGGLCPSCLLLAAALSTGGLPGGLANAPSIESVRAAFPELEIVELFGHGGMGVVFKARQPRLDRLVALKILPPALAAQPGFSERFVREARTLGRLSHPNIVGVYDFGERAGFYYLIMEFVNGVNLRQAMRAGVTPEQALALVPRICEALQFAHDHGVLHRDIKPENILLDTEGTPKLADFGIAKIAGATGAQSGLTQTGASLGTAVYMAPEQIERPATVDHRADIYSLGVVLYEMLTGELPLGRFAAPSEKSTVARGVDELVMRALEKERERRQQSATQMKTEVEGTQGRVQAPTGRSRRPAIRGWWWLAAAVNLAVFAFITLRSFNARQDARLAAQSAAATKLPVAVVLPVRAPFSATIGKGTIELMAVSNSPSKGQRWWQMDGFPSASGYDVKKLDYSLQAGERAYDLVFRRQGFPIHTSFLSYSSPTEIRCLSSGLPDLKLSDYHALTAIIPSSERTLTLRAAIASAPWQIINESAANNSTAGTFKYGGVDWKFGHGAAHETNTGETVVAFNCTTPADWEITVCGITDYGNEVRYSHMTGTEEQSEWIFSEPKWGKISQFRLQVRPIDWVEFRDIVLPPLSAPVAEAKAAAGVDGVLPTPKPPVAVVTPNVLPPSAKIGPGTIELIGVSKRGSDGPWWGMDGSPAKGPGFSVKNSAPNKEAPMDGYDVVFHRHGFLPESSTTTFATTGSQESFGGSETLNNPNFLPGSEWPDYEMVHVNPATGTRVISIRAGINSEPWHTLIADHTDITFSGRKDTPSYEDQKWDVYRSAPIVSKDGDTVISMVYDVPANWEARVTVVLDGKELNADGGDGSRSGAPYGAMMGWTWTFHTKGKLADEVRFQVRPIDWVEFRDIALAPRSALDANPTAIPSPGANPSMSGDAGTADAKDAGGAAPLPGVDSLYDKNIELARKNLERVRERLNAKLVSQEDVDAAEQDLTIAEARGNALLVNQARLKFLDKQLVRVHALLEAGLVSQEDVDALELKKNQVQLEIANAQPPAAKTEPPDLKAIYDEGLRLARENLENTRKMEKAGIVVPSDVRTAERDVAIAEARGDAVSIAKARLAYAGDYLAVLQEHQKSGTVGAGDVHQAEVAKNQAAAELAKAQAAGAQPAAKVETLEANKNYDEAIRLAHEYVDRTRQQYQAGIVSQIEVRAAECELEVAEARGDALRIAKSRLAYATDLVEVDQKRYQSGNLTSAELYQAQLAKNQAQAELLKAQTAAGETPAKNP